MKPYLITGAVGGAVAAAVAIVLFSLAKKQDREETCALNLRWLGMAIDEASPSDAKAWDAVPAGSSFWLSHREWPRVPLREIVPPMLLCPLRGSPEGRTGTDYRGPCRSLREMAPGDPIGADRPGNHGPGRGGNVLLRSGALYPVRETEDLWLRAAETTAD